VSIRDAKNEASNRAIFPGMKNIREIKATVELPEWKNSQ
jgi:hypothetical protein